MEGGLEPSTAEHPHLGVARKSQEYTLAKGLGFVYSVCERLHEVAAPFGAAVSLDPRNGGEDTMRTTVLLLVGVLALGVAGCTGIYSSQEFGPENLTGQSLQELIQNHGCPDIVGGNNQMMVVGWYRTKAFQVLSLFATMEKKALGAVIDQQGVVVSRGIGRSGKGITILGGMIGPVIPVETK